MFMEEKIKQLKELFNQRDEIDNQIAEMLGENKTKPVAKKKPVTKIAITKPITKKVAIRRNGKTIMIKGKWSKKYDKCQRCGTTEEPHDSKGLCHKCYRIVKREKKKTESAIKKTIVKKEHNGIGDFNSRWHKKYDKCQGCGTTERPHYCKGYCNRCYQTKWKRDARAETKDESKDIETSSAGSKYKCEVCDYVFFSVSDYLDVECPECGSRTIIKLPR